VVDGAFGVSFLSVLMYLRGFGVEFASMFPPTSCQQVGLILHYSSGTSPRKMFHDSLHDSTSRISDSETRAQPPHTLSAQLFESGLEVAPASEHDKQFVNHVREGDKEVVNQSEKEAVPSDRPGHCSEQITKPKSRKILGLKRIWFWSLLVALLLAIALGVGLGVGLTSKDSSESSTTSSTPSTSTQPPSPTAVLSDELKIGGSLNDSYYSSSGAWNGSGIAQVWQNFAQNFTDTSTANQHEIVVYYQDHDGDIRWLRETSNTTSVWQPGPADVAVMAEDARNSTPIAAVHWDSDGANYWHVFCKSALHPLEVSRDGH
jgi:hypothetical protein